MTILAAAVLKNASLINIVLSPPLNVSPTTSQGQAGLTWTNPAEFDAIEVDRKITGDPETSWTNVQTGTQTSHTSTGLDGGRLYSLRIRTTKVGLTPSPWIVFENLRPTDYTDIYEDAPTSLLLLHPKRQDTVFNDKTGTSEAGDTQAVLNLTSLSAAVISVLEDDIGENLIYDGVNGRVRGAGAAATKEHLILSPIISIANATIVYSFDYDDTINGQRAIESNSNAPSLRITNPTTIRTKLDDGTIHDFTVPTMAAGHHVVILVIDSITDPANTVPTLYVDNNTPITSGASPVGLTTFSAKTIGNAGNTERGPVNGFDFLEIKNYALTAAQVTTWINRCATAATGPIEDWTPETNPGGGGPTRPLQLSHIDSAIGESVTKPGTIAGVLDMSAYNKPAWVMTETKKLVEKELFTIPYAISAQTTSSEKQVGLAGIDSALDYLWHRSPRASQAFAIAGKEDQQGAGMAFAGFGPITYGTKQNPYVNAKHFLYGAATTLTTALDVGDDVCNVANRGVLKTGNYCIIYHGVDASDINDPELCYLEATPGSGNQVRFRNSGKQIGRGYMSTERLHAAGYYIRKVLTAAGGDARNFAYNYMDLAHLADDAGRRPWQAQAYFDEQNWNRNKLGNIIAGFAGKGIFRDVHLRYIPNNKDADAALSPNVGVWDDGWVGAINKFAEGIQKFDDRIASSFPNMIHNAGYEFSSNPRHYHGTQQETMVGGNNWLPTTGADDGDTHLQLHDYWRHAVKGSAMIAEVSKHRDFLFHEDLVPNATWGYKLNRYHLAMASMLDGVFCKQNYNKADYTASVANQSAMLNLGAKIGDSCRRTDTGSVWALRGNDSTQLSNWLDTQSDNGPLSEFPYYPECSVYRNQPALAGKGYTFGQCLYPYDGSTSIADVKAGRGYLGQQLWNWVRVYDQSQWARGNATNDITFASNIVGWNGDDCDVIHNSVDGVLEMSGWAANKPYPWWPNAEVTGPSLSVVQNNWYTLILRMRCIDPLNTRMVRVGLKGEDIQQVGLMRQWHNVVLSFKAKSTGNKKISIECGLFPEAFQVQSALFYEGDLRTYRCDYDHGIIVARGPGVSTTTVNLGDTYKELLYNAPNKSFIDSENRLNGLDRTSIQLAANDAAILLYPEAA